MHHHTLLRHQLRALFLPLLIASLALLLPAIPLHAASVIYAAPGGAGTQTGADWANAKDLQAALQAAISGDQIWAKAGIYKPTSGSDRSATFQLKSGVALYGGFAGTEASLDQRDPSAHTSALSGDLLGNDSGAVASNNPTRSENSYHVVTSNATDATTVLDGFTISGGNANHYDSLWTADSEGGGMRNNQGSPTLVHVIFSNNSAISGGGMVNNNPSSPILSQVRFIGNTASVGGGITNFGGAPTIIQAIFSGNSATYGGGIYNYLSNPIIIQTTFANNAASMDSGGAMWNGYISSNPIIRNSIFWDNQGGQIITSQGAPDVQYSLIQGGYVTGTHIFDADPLFVDADGADNIAGTNDDNLRLQVRSPAIDAGSNTFIPPDLTDENNNNNTSEAVPFDLDGNPRIDGTNVDLGAYEAQLHLQIVSSLPPSGTYGGSYSHMFATASQTPVTYSVTAGSLPPGLGLDTATGLLSGTPTAAGSYSGIAITASSADGSAHQAFAILIHPAALVITADAKTRVYATLNPPLTASYSGFVNGDAPASLDIPASLATTATIGSPPGSYPITASGAADANYAITFVPATLTITSGHTYLPLVGR